MNRSVQSWFGLFSYLLHYPDTDWRTTLPDIRSELANAGSDEIVGHLQAFLDCIDEMNDEMPNHYVSAFDFNKKTNLYMTYAQFGEERERGPALLQLKQKYEEAGFEMTSQELSDYLPLILEFASAAPAAAAVEVLNVFRGRIEELRAELHRLESPYSHVFDALSAGYGQLEQTAGPTGQEVAQ